MSRVVEAAALMKARAEDATAGPWFADGFTIRGGKQGLAVGSAHNADLPNAHLIASLHPGVAFVIADALTAIEAAAAWGDWPSVHAALNRVADVYLNDSPGGD